jgi:hypothetical protein
LADVSTAHALAGALRGPGSAHSPQRMPSSTDKKLSRFSPTSGTIEHKWPLSSIL